MQVGNGLQVAAGDVLTLTAGDFDMNVDGSTIEVNGTNQLQVKDAGITAVTGQALNQHQTWQGNVSKFAAAVTIPSCGANQYLKYNNAGGWTCENDAGASGTVADIASTAPVKVNGATTAQTGSVTTSVDDATTGGIPTNPAGYTSQTTTATTRVSSKQILSAGAVSALTSSSASGRRVSTHLIINPQ